MNGVKKSETKLAVWNDPALQDLWSGPTQATMVSTDPHQQDLESFNPSYISYATVDPITMFLEMQSALS